MPFWRLHVPALLKNCNSHDNWAFKIPETPYWTRSSAALELPSVFSRITKLPGAMRGLEAQERLGLVTMPLTEDCGEILRPAGASMSLGRCQWWAMLVTMSWRLLTRSLLRLPLSQCLVLLKAGFSYIVVDVICLCLWVLTGLGYWLFLSGIMDGWAEENLGTGLHCSSS